MRWTYSAFKQFGFGFGLWRNKTNRDIIYTIAIGPLSIYISPNRLSAPVPQNPEDHRAAPAPVHPAVGRIDNPELDHV